MQNVNPPSPKASDGQGKIFLAVIIAGFIIGGFVYFGLKNNNLEFTPAAKMPIPQFSQRSSQNEVKSVASVSDATIVASTNLCGASDQSIVTKVIDGDTVVVEGGYHVRLLGMDADEKGYSCYQPAKDRIEQLILGKMVKLEKDKTDLDQYGRCLRYIFIGNTNVDVQLVKEGLAVARFYEPDVKYRIEIGEVEKEAIAGKVGCKWIKN